MASPIVKLFYRRSKMQCDHHQRQVLRLLLAIAGSFSSSLIVAKIASPSIFTPFLSCRVCATFYYLNEQCTVRFANVESVESVVYWITLFIGLLLIYIIMDVDTIHWSPHRSRKSYVMYLLLGRMVFKVVATVRIVRCCCRCCMSGRCVHTTIGKIVH